MRGSFLAGDRSLAIAHHSATGREMGGHDLGHALEIGDAGRRRIKRGDAVDMGFHRPQRRLVDIFDNDAVLPRAPAQILHRYNFRLAGRDDQLAEPLKPDAMFSGESFGGLHPSRQKRTFMLPGT